MTARANLEAQLHSCLAKYKQNVADGMWRVTADNTLVDAFLKAADKYAEHGARAAVTEHETARQRQRQEAARPLLQAVHAIKAGTR